MLGIAGFVRGVLGFLFLSPSSRKRPLVTLSPPPTSGKKQLNSALAAFVTSPSLEAARRRLQQVCDRLVHEEETYQAACDELREYDLRQELAQAKKQAIIAAANLDADIWAQGQSSALSPSSSLLSAQRRVTAAGLDPTQRRRTACCKRTRPTRSAVAGRPTLPWVFPHSLRCSCCSGCRAHCT
jgi:hypothetical protein